MKCSLFDRWSCNPGKCVVNHDTHKPSCVCDDGGRTTVPVRGYFGGCDTADTKRARIENGSVNSSEYDSNSEQLVVNAKRKPNRGKFALFNKEGEPIHIEPGARLPFVLQERVAVYDADMRMAVVSRSDVLRAILDAPFPYSKELRPVFSSAPSSEYAANVRSNASETQNAKVPHKVLDIVTRVVMSADPRREAQFALSELESLGSPQLKSVAVARTYLLAVQRDQASASEVPGYVRSAVEEDVSKFERGSGVDLSRLKVSFPRS